MRFAEGRDGRKGRKEGLGRRFFFCFFFFISFPFSFLVGRITVVLGNDENKKRWRGGRERGEKRERERERGRSRIG